MTPLPPRDEPRVISEWSIDTLYIHLSRIVEDLDKRLQIALKSVEQTAAAAQASSERATNKAETAMEKRFEGVNEFRQTLGDQASKFITRAEVEARMMSSDKETAGVVSRLDRIEATAMGKTETVKSGQTSANLILIIVGTVIAFCAAAVGAVALFVSLYHKA